jgi:hypothetical protein
MSGLIHADFAENYALVDSASFVGVTNEQNTGYVDLSAYVRLVILIHAIAVGTTLDADVEIATTSGGANAHTIKSITQLGGSDDGAVVVIDLRPDDLNNPAGATADDGYRYLNVEVTPSGSATVSVLVLGALRNSGSASTTWDEAVS